MAPAREGQACIEGTCDRYTAGDADRIALNIVSRGIVGTDPAVDPRTSRTFSRNNKNGFAGDLRILASWIAPVASLMTPHARNTMLCYSNELSKERNKE